MLNAPTKTVATIPHHHAEDKYRFSAEKKWIFKYMTFYNNIVQNVSVHGWWFPTIVIAEANAKKKSIVQ